MLSDDTDCRSRWCRFIDRCDECVTSRREDSLRHSRSRINAYRALASPSLIALSSKDPILTAFELSWELRRLSFLEHEFKCEYQVRRLSDTLRTIVPIKTKRSKTLIGNLKDSNRRWSDNQSVSTLRVRKLKATVSDSGSEWNCLVKQRDFLLFQRIPSLTARRRCYSVRRLFTILSISFRPLWRCSLGDPDYAGK